MSARPAGVHALLALGLTACSAAPAPLEIVLRVPPQSHPLAIADQVTVSIADGAGRVWAFQRAASAAASLTLGAVPAHAGYVASVEGRFGDDVVARGQSCPFTLRDNAAAPPVAVYFDRVGRFSATGAPAAARSGAVLFATAAGALLVGGDTGAGAAPTSEAFTQATGGFTPGPPLGAARSGAVGALLPDGTPVVIGGAATNGPAVEALSDGQWIPQPATVPPELTGSAALSLGDGAVLIAGGQRAATATAGAWFVGLGLTNSAPATPLVRARARHTLTASDEPHPTAAFVIGGQDDGGLVEDIELYDAGAASFSLVGARLLTPRRDHTTTRLPSGELLVAGGSDAGGIALAAAELFDPATRQLRSTGSLHTARSRHSAILLGDGRVLVAGGVDASGAPTSAVEIFDPAIGPEGDFVATTPLAKARTGPLIVALCDGALLVVGGGAGAELYVPAP